ncbi:MAG: hypothetical protein LBF59_05270 [Prevotellaceae bacterium]|nr:hypothetical protein [Prevotellaceae bacterium]
MSNHIHGIIVITDNAAGRGVSHTPYDNTPHDNTQASNKVNKVNKVNRGVCDTPLQIDALNDHSVVWCITSTLSHGGWNFLFCCAIYATPLSSLW